MMSEDKKRLELVENLRFALKEGHDYQAPLKAINDFKKEQLEKPRAQRTFLGAPIIATLSEVAKKRQRMAAIDAVSPPLCNTGDTQSKQDKEALKNKNQKIKYNKNNNLTSLDWLRVTTKDVNVFHGAMGDIQGILEEADMCLHWLEKGFLGYDHLCNIKIWKDNDYQIVANLAYSEAGGNKGGLFELTGLGCKILQIDYPELWEELYQVLLHSGEWKITRCDIALDMPGEFVKKTGWTVPKLFELAETEGFFHSQFSGSKQSVEPVGDWTNYIVKRLTPDSYDPLEHCPKGITAYIGSRKSSDDFFRVYEKGKQLLSLGAEEGTIDQAWTRIEHEMSCKTGRRYIPFEVMLNSDRFFCADRPQARAIMEELRSFFDMKAYTLGAWKKENHVKERTILVSHKVLHARRSYGRLVRTLYDQGCNSIEIMEMLIRETGLEECIYDLDKKAA